MAESKRPRGRDLDRDPETGQPEDHPLGIAGGALTGGAAGGVAGSVIGGIAGKAIAERVDPSHEEACWRNEYPRRPFDEIEHELAHDWTAERGQSRLDWPDAREAARDAYERLASGRNRRDEIPMRQ